MLTLSGSERTRRKYILYKIKKTISTFWRVNITECVIHGWSSVWIVIIRDLSQILCIACLSAFWNRRFPDLSKVLNINFHQGFLRSAEVFFFFPRKRGKHDLIYHRKPWKWTAQPTAARLINQDRVSEWVSAIGLPTNLIDVTSYPWAKSTNFLRQLNSNLESRINLAY